MEDAAAFRQVCTKIHLFVYYAVCQDAAAFRQVCTKIHLFVYYAVCPLQLLPICCEVQAIIFDCMQRSYLQ